MSIATETSVDSAAALQARVGPLQERLAPLASEWTVANGYRVCARVREAVIGDDPWLCCLTHGARAGFKGRGTADWLIAEGVLLPDGPNRWRRDGSGAIVARLGAQDFLIFDDGDTDTGLPDRLTRHWQTARGRGGYPVPRQHSLACIAVGGARAPDLFARLCAVDLDAPAFGADAIAQTHIALTGAVVMRAPPGTAAGYRVFVDTSLALYLWDVLHEVALALGGGVRGAAQLPRD